MSVSDENLLSALEESTDERESPVATPSDVAEDLPIGAEAVRQRLLKLAADDDGIQTRKVGRSRVFWTWGPVVGSDDDGSGGRADHGADPTPATEEFDPTADVDELLQEESDDVDDDRRDWLAELETPPQSTREEFEDAAAAVVQRAKDGGTVTRKQAQAALHHEHPAGYEENARTWWRKVAKPVLAGHPDVESPPKGASKWRHSG